MSIWKTPSGKVDSYGQEHLTWSRAFYGAVSLAALLVVLLIGYWFYWVNTHQSVEQDSIAVTRGSGPIDKQKKKVKDGPLGPGRIKHNIFDTVWTYPSEKALRFQNFTLTDVATKDGKKLTIKGQIAFRFVGGSNKEALLDFARGVGARPYGPKGEKCRPGESIECWSYFLDSFFTPALNSEGRQAFGSAYCADFEPRCVLIDTRMNVPDPKPAALYKRISTSLQLAVADKMGQKAGSTPFFSEFKMTVKDIDLDPIVQQNIDKISTEQARTQAAEQAERTAAAEARAIRIKGRALQGNKSLVGVEIVKACEGKCTVIVDGTGKGATVAQGLR